MITLADFLFPLMAATKWEIKTSMARICINQKRIFQLPHSHFNPLDLHPLSSVACATIQITSTSTAFVIILPSPHVSIDAAIIVIGSKRPLEHSRRRFNPSVTAFDHSMVMEHNVKWLVLCYSLCKCVFLLILLIIKLKSTKKWMQLWPLLMQQVPRPPKKGGCKERRE